MVDVSAREIVKESQTKLVNKKPGELRVILDLTHAFKAQDSKNNSSNNDIEFQLRFNHIAFKLQYEIRNCSLRIKEALIPDLIPT